MLLIRNRVRHDADWAPEKFEFSPAARVEIRPVKTKENTTGFVYPK